MRARGVTTAVAAIAAATGPVLSGGPGHSAPLTTEWAELSRHQQGLFAAGDSQLCAPLPRRLPPPPPTVRQSGQRGGGGAASAAAPCTALTCYHTGPAAALTQPCAPSLTCYHRGAPAAALRKTRLQDMDS